ncbi:MAG TPA: signal recognition particle protein [Syntrophomonadaceae bacterium]|nr:signal recognition particle protein [Syntrophomonadaceae bacterium]
MLFEGLAERLQNTFKKLRGKGKLTESDINEALREVRLALLEADVNLAVVKQFTQRIKERCLGVEVLESLTPAQQVIKIVNDELTSLMGGDVSKINFNPAGPSIFLLVGLQGSGKTTTAGKLALLFRKQGRRPLLVGADVYRPAAIKQLEVLAKQINIPFFSLGEQADPVRIAEESLGYAKAQGCDLIIIDTAGRLHIDEELMEELKRLKNVLKPQEILLVVDAMTGQDAVNVAKSFHEELELSGIILTKLDGDTRGGAALSVKAVTGCPIKFIGTGEKLDALEPFHPDRMASRILGMGDVLSLIEKAQAAFDQEKARELERKLRKQEFTLEDFVEQIKQVRSMGPLEQVLSMIPGLGGAKQLKKLQEEFDEKEFVYLEAIINSMTPEERRNPSIINGSRRRRIARGSGTSVQDVNRMLKQFEQTRKIMKQFSELSSGKSTRKLKSFKFPF